MVTVFDAISSATRRQLIETLAASGECNVSALVEGAGMSQPAVSQQLAILREAGLVIERKDGRFRHYSLRGAPLREVAEWIERYRTFWTERLDALSTVLDEMEPPKKKRKRT
jgi:DNA-binding transcriptional ArsR family regulator